MREKISLRSNRILSEDDTRRWEETVRTGSGLGKYSAAAKTLQSAVRTVKNERSLVWLFGSEEEILENPDLQPEEKLIALKIFRTEKVYPGSREKEPAGFVGWLRVGWGVQSRKNAMELLKGEDDLEIVRPYNGGH